jgi:hypothetical protein
LKVSCMDRWMNAPFYISLLSSKRSRLCSPHKLREKARCARPSLEHSRGEVASRGLDDDPDPQPSGKLYNGRLISRPRRLAASEAPRSGVDPNGHRYACEPYRSGNTAIWRCADLGGCGVGALALGIHPRRLSRDFRSCTIRVKAVNGASYLMHRTFTVRELSLSATV